MSEPSFYVPQTHLRAPELLLPGRKPSFPVEIDWTHSLTKNLFRVLFVEQGVIHDLLTGETFQLGSNGASYEQGAAYNDTDLRFSVGGPLYPTKYGFTAMTTIKSHDTSSDTQVYWYDSSGATAIYTGLGAAGQSIREMHFRYQGSTGTIGATMQMSDSAASNDFEAFAVLAAAKGRKNVVVARQGNDRYLKVFITGNNSATSTEPHDNSLLVPSTTRYLNNVGYFNETNRYMRGYSDIFVSWSEPLSDEESQSLVDDPYQFLKPRGSI